MEIKPKKIVKGKVNKTAVATTEVNTKLIKSSAINLATYLIEKEKLNSDDKIEAKGIEYNGQKCAMSYALLSNNKLIGAYRALPTKKVSEARAKNWGGNITLSSDGKNLELKRFNKESGKEEVNKAMLFDLE